jgi:lipoprotein-anchoring transpeptidase ErfK/SrfK
VRISLAAQRLDLLEEDRVVVHHPVSTAALGPGEQMGSECTPRGEHVVRAKIGAGCPSGTVFAARRPTGEICTPARYHAEPERDWILTRILWLSGCEPGRNRLRDVDSMRRYIYIHGCPDELPVGVPLSHGCVRMRNRHVIELFDRVPVGTRVRIEED